ncbi:GNAT family N-acetyltransferase [Flavobacterium humi]|uniref:GNAT family N-acetyltransferase n=1 Tax=Flavobacterium humi TaxID=2562683 RepID=A0A4Z0L6W9_9FLAO|nr:GNAT family N-acetyltransferase [Flavobacterium humi]TGD57991.1 GNAT family N-acetyltransferase [Flavobacterium humi]
MELRIRNAETKDSEAIANLSGQLGYESTESQIRKRLEILLASKDHCVLVAVEDGIVAGWIHAFHSVQVESGFFVEIGGLVIDENHRRKGIGQLLMERVLPWAKSRGCLKIRVRCNTKRAASHLFYRSIGFTETKEQKIFDREI